MRSRKQNAINLSEDGVENVASPSTYSDFHIQFQPYPVQKSMMEAINVCLEGKRGSSEATPVVATEVPTGCGKTLALLSAALQYQSKLKSMLPDEAKAYLEDRRLNYSQTRQTFAHVEKVKAENPMPLQCENESSTIDSKFDASILENQLGDSTSLNDEEASWQAPIPFFNHFSAKNKRVRPSTTMKPRKTISRGEVKFSCPPCTIFFCARTHSQLAQSVRELNKIQGAHTKLRMNILASRDRYCVHPTILKAKAAGTLPVENNNLGEMCDKLVSLGQCNGFTQNEELTCRALDGHLNGKRDRVWDIEDLVTEAVTIGQCPYYASRDLVFIADINFCTYSYLLDPIIRSECKMESAIKNNSIVIFDESHNIAGVCQEAMSLTFPACFFDLVDIEIAPLAQGIIEPFSTQGEAEMKKKEGSGSRRFPSHNDVELMAAKAYSRDFKLSEFTLAELFSFLMVLARSFSSYFNEISQPCGSKSVRNVRSSSDPAVKAQRFSAEKLADYMKQRAQQHAEFLFHRADGGNYRNPQGKRKEAEASTTLWWKLFQQLYSIIMPLGVTFNPFFLSIFVIGKLKRWLLIVRFLFQSPKAFALAVRDATVEEEFDFKSIIALLAQEGKARSTLMRTSDSPESRFNHHARHDVYEVFCQDGSLAFQHLLKSTYRVILASGTLSPFAQLSRELGLCASSMLSKFEGRHVVSEDQYRVISLSCLPRENSENNALYSQLSCVNQTDAVPLHCTYSNLSNHVFLSQLAKVISDLSRLLKRGGILVFCPNYNLQETLALKLREIFSGGQKGIQSRSSLAVPIPIFSEPRKSSSLPAILDAFRTKTKQSCAIFFSVYRGKISEGIDFTDDMSRCVLCIGIPYKPLNSWKVEAQRTYYGSEWYDADALRAVNQALGRCLRHIHDYGAVLLLDDRYETHAVHRKNLSRWCRDELQSYQSFPDFCDALKSFFDRFHLSFTCQTPVKSSSSCVASNEQSCSHAPVDDSPDPIKPYPISNPVPMGGVGNPKGAMKPLSEVHVLQSEQEFPPIWTRNERKRDRCSESFSVSLQNPLCSTAWKLLSEEVNHGCEITADGLQARIKWLEEHFFT